MTEQEKRERAIDELEKDICNGCKYAKGKDLCCICEVKDYAKTIADLHYRKEEEVRKETATKFLFEAKRILSEYEHSIYGEMFVEVFVKLLQVSKEFGVEVDE